LNQRVNQHRARHDHDQYEHPVGIKKLHGFQTKFNVSALRQDYAALRSLEF
jgi:hypothetical protein